MSRDGWVVGGRGEQGLPRGSFHRRDGVGHGALRRPGGWSRLPENQPPDPEGN